MSFYGNIVLPMLKAKPKEEGIIILLKLFSFHLKWPVSQKFQQNPKATLQYFYFFSELGALKKTNKQTKTKQNSNNNKKQPLHNLISTNSLCVDKLLFWLLLHPSFFWVSFWKI